MFLFFIAPNTFCIHQTFFFIYTWYPIQNQKWTTQRTDHKFGFSSHSKRWSHHEQPELKLCCMSDGHLHFPKSAILVHVKVGSQATTSRLFNLNIQGFCFLFDSVLVVETHGKYFGPSVFMFVAKSLSLGKTGCQQIALLHSPDNPAYKFFRTASCSSIQSFSLSG